MTTVLSSLQAIRQLLKASKSLIADFSSFSLYNLKVSIIPPVSVDHILIVPILSPVYMNSPSSEKHMQKIGTGEIDKFSSICTWPKIVFI